MQDLLLDGSLTAVHQAIVDRKISVSEIAAWYAKRINALAGLNAVRVVSSQALEISTLMKYFGKPVFIQRE